MYVGLTFYKYRGDVVVKHNYIVQRLLSFQNKHAIMFYDQQSTQYHTQNSLVRWMKRSKHSDYASGNLVKTGDKSSLHCVFSRKTSFKSILKLI